MKYITLLTLVLFTIACGNKKEEIVEQIKAYKDSTRNADVALSKISDAQYKIGAERKSKETPIDFNKKWTSSELQTINAKNDSIFKIYKEIELRFMDSVRAERASLDVKKLLYKAKIDSLELELKKY